MAMTAFEVFGLLKLDTSEFDKGLSKAEGKASTFGSVAMGGLATAAKVGAAAVAATTTAVVGFGTKAVQAGSTFDQAMGGVAATLGETVDDLNSSMGSVDTSFGHFEGSLREFAQYMGQNTVFSATQAAQALNYMALAGYKTQESMEMLPAVLDMAAAGSMDLALASDMITDTQSALGLSFDRTNQMVNEFAKAASSGNTNVQQLGEAFLRVGGLARELNGGMITLSDGTQVEIDGVQQLEAALTAMANAGIKGAEAGTHMRNMLLKLSNPTDAGTQALEEMGVAIFDAEGKMNSLGDIFNDLNVAMSTMTQQERISTIADLFNTRDLASAEALLAAVEGTVVKIGDDVYSMETAYEMFGDSIYDSSQGFEIVQSSFDSLGESIMNAGTAATDMSKTKLDNLNGDITLFKSALESAYITINDKLSPGLRKFTQFGSKSVSNLTSAFQKGGLAGAMKEFGNVLSEGLNMIVQQMPSVVNAGMELLGALGQGILDNLDVIIDSAIQIVESLLFGLVEALPRLAEGALQIIISLAEGLTEMLPTLIPAIVQVIEQIVETLTDPDTLTKLIDVALALILALAEGLLKAAPKLLSKAPVIISSLVEALIAELPKIWDAGVQILFELFNAFIAYVGEMILAGEEVVNKVIEGIQGFWNNLVNIGKDIINHVKEGVMELIDAAKQWGADLIQNFIDGIVEKWDALKKKVADLGGMIKDYIGFSEPEKGPLSNFHTFAPDMIDLFVKGIEDNEQKLTDAMTDAFDFEPYMNASYGVKTVGNTIGSEQSGLVAAMVDALRTVAPEFATNIRIDGNRDRIVDIMVEENEKSVYAYGKGLLEA